VQGANDPNVTPENVRVVEEALRRAQVRYETLVFANEGHGLRKLETLRVLYARLIEFFGDAFAGQAGRPRPGTLPMLSPAWAAQGGETGHQRQKRPISPGMPCG